MPERWSCSNSDTKIKALPPVCEKPDPPTQANQDVGGVEPIGAVSDVMSDLLTYAFASEPLGQMKVEAVRGWVEGELFAQLAGGRRS